MANPNESAEKPLRRISSWKVFGVFCLVSFQVFLGVIFVPWDVKAPNAPELKLKRLNLPPAQNAFTYFESASKKVVVDLPAYRETNRKWEDLTKRFGNPEEHWDPVFAEAMLAANREALAELEKGVACEHYESPLVEDYRFPFVWLKKYKQLAQTLSIKSKQAQLAGDYAQAVQAAIQARKLGQRVTGNPDSVIEWLVGVACDLIALGRLEEIAADASTPESVLRELQAQLDQWDPQLASEGYAQSQRAEYHIAMNMIQMLRNDPERYMKLIETGEANGAMDRVVVFATTKTSYCLKTNMTDRLFTHFFLTNLGFGPRYYVDCRGSHAFRMPTTGFGKLGLLASPNSVGKILYSMLTPALEKLAAKKCQERAEIEALRLKVALRLYELKHGQLPDDLNALVPEYLKDLPMDPYDGKTFRYSKADKKLWAIGSDLKDNAGNRYENGIMQEHKGGYDLVMPLGTREMKPTLIPPPANKEDEDCF
jgi:tetratricopeptide (TPR) repeat protein